jgi:aminoglycoside phosphotransferase (APT) family kinase protein
MSDTIDPVILDFLRTQGLWAGEPVRLEPLTGGVSSDILKGTIGGQTLVVKRALAKLKVAADWQVPTNRNLYEVRWLRTAGAIMPDHVPAVLADDPDAGLFAMGYMPAERHPVWKAQLRDGHADPAFSSQLGRVLASIHAATARKPDVQSEFETTDLFRAIRLDPYLGALKPRHPALAARLDALIEGTAARRLALVHGDVSPKNILAGPKGPVILDAECAWYGDPAFDPAFCLNHLLLKGVWNRSAAPQFHTCFAALLEAYGKGVTWEPPIATLARIAALLPALLLARIDGKSPVEYITSEADRVMVRTIALSFFEHPTPDPLVIADAMRDRLRLS